MFSIQFTMKIARRWLFWKYLDNRINGLLCRNLQLKCIPNGPAILGEEPIPGGDCKSRRGQYPGHLPGEGILNLLRRGPRPGPHGVSPHAWSAPSRGRYPGVARTTAEMWPESGPWCPPSTWPMKHRVGGPVKGKGETEKDTHHLFGQSNFWKFDWRDSPKIKNEYLS